MKEKTVMLVLLATLALMASGRDKSLHGFIHDDRSEASVSAQHESTHGGPAVFKPEFENESVQVVRITIGPHAKLRMHDLTARVVVLLTDQDLRVTLPNGETREEHHKAGETMWVSAQRHAGENLADKPIEFIAVIPKQK
jgi:quercetin dioxygenase-like cupin family protein